jgi:hypothetical protein
MAPKILSTSRIIIPHHRISKREKALPQNRECFPYMYQRPMQDDSTQDTTRDSGEHFPAFNLAIRLHGVKNSKEIDLREANFACRWRLTGVGGA